MCVSLGGGVCVCACAHAHVGVCVWGCTFENWKCRSTAESKGGVEVRYAYAIALFLGGIMMLQTMQCQRFQTLQTMHS